jgi:hypothetical protein
MIEMVDVYHPGEELPMPPFLLVSAGTRSLIPAPPGTKWHFWKQVPINIMPWTLTGPKG